MISARKIENSVKQEIAEEKKNPAPAQADCPHTTVICGICLNCEKPVSNRPDSFMNLNIPAF